MSRIFLSSSCVDSNNIIDAVTRLKGISSNIELSGGTRFMDDSLIELDRIKCEYGLTFLLHSYFPPPWTDFVLNFADTSDCTHEFIAKSMQYVQMLGIPYYSVHAGFHKTFSVENEMLINGTGKFCLNDIAENIAWFRSSFPDTPLAIENLYPNNNSLETCLVMTVAEIDRIMGYDGNLLLLLDLGHLKISAAYLGFDFEKAVDMLFFKYQDRIAELHLSENASFSDDHDIIYENSRQYAILKRHINTIKQNNITLTIEARGKSLETLMACHDLIWSLFKEEK